MTDDALTAATEELIASTTARLATAANNPQLQAATVLTYIKTGYSLGLVAGELVDFFCVDTPNIIESAGYSDAASDDLTALFDRLHDNYLQGTAT